MDTRLRNRAVRVAVPVLAVAVLVALKPEILRGTFSSVESVLRVAAVIAIFVFFSRLMRRVISNPWVASVVVTVPAVAVLWVNVAPYFEDDVEITSSFPETFTTQPATAAATGETSSEQPAGPVQLTTGRFTGLDGHRGSGEASIFRLPDGTYVVAFREVSVSSVPDPVLYVVPGADRERPSDGIRLGTFDGSRDRYEIPSGTSLDAPFTVLIWCQRFAVPVAGATQTATRDG